MDEVSNEQVVIQLVDSVMEVFGIMLGLDVQAGEAHVAGDGPHSSGVKGAIGLTGDLPGVIALNMSRSDAATAVEVLLGTPAAEVANTEIMDTVGEMTNMIAGGLKTRLSDRPGVSIEISLPTILIGESYEFDAAGTASSLVIPVLGAGDSTYVELFASADSDRAARIESGCQPAVAGKEKP